MKIEQLYNLEDDYDDLISLLNDCVEAGASIGFISPMETSEAEGYWRTVSREITDGHRVLMVKREAGRIVGTVQVSHCAKRNGRHRAEIEKLMVHPEFRQRGIARRLMIDVERHAKANQCTLLVLDTRSDDVASILYRDAGYQEAGRIPQYAQSPSGVLESTTYFYKLI